MSLQRLGGDEDAGAEQITDVPDVRACDSDAACRGPEAEPDREYHCEHVGLLGTYSIAERVRYRGELQDPNEVALMISAGAMSLLIGFALRKRTPAQRRAVRRAARCSRCSPCTRRSRAAAGRGAAGARRLRRPALRGARGDSSRGGRATADDARRASRCRCSRGSRATRSSWRSRLLG